MQVLRQWTVDGNRVTPAQHPLLAQAGMLARIAVAQTGAGIADNSQNTAAANDSSSDTSQPTDLQNVVATLANNNPCLQANAGIVKTLQQLAGVAVDGKYGPTTAGKAQAVDPYAPGPCTPAPAWWASGAGNVKPAPIPAPTPSPSKPVSLVTCPDGTVHPAGYKCSKPLLSGFLGNWGVLAGLGVAVAGALIYFTSGKSSKMPTSAQFHSPEPPPPPTVASPGAHA